MYLFQGDDIVHSDGEHLNVRSLDEYSICSPYSRVKLRYLIFFNKSTNRYIRGHIFFLLLYRSNIDTKKIEKV